jgi:hypothetical protein
LVSLGYDCVPRLVPASEDGNSTPRVRELVPAQRTAGGKPLLAGGKAACESLPTSPLPASTTGHHRSRSIERDAATSIEGGNAIQDDEYPTSALAAPVHASARTTIAPPCAAVPLDESERVVRPA